MISGNIISILLSAGASVLISLLLNHKTIVVAQDWYFGPLFFTITCFCLNIFYTRAVSTGAFTQKLMAGIVIKLLLALIFVVLYLFWNKPGFFYFAVHFMIHYILFTVFEIRYLLTVVKTKSPLNPPKST
jgi:hypothetical protein